MIQPPGIFKFLWRFHFFMVNLVNHSMPKMEILFYDLRHFLTFIITLGICLVLCKFLLWLERTGTFWICKVFTLMNCLFSREMC
jgi:hypothetical protein